ncbi:MAG TPA: YCF48-related protein [Terriglobales bacterium]|nr:YCF48-related protein [Terriglobales bacterium]
MSELAKFAAQRLRTSDPPGLHPTADLLTAFAEQVLAAEEREMLLAHLAACDNCRAVVWHALPESEAAQHIVVSTPSRGWSWSLAWRWAGIAAGIVVIAGVAMLFRGGPGPAGERVASAPRKPAVNQKRDMQAAFDKEAAPAPVPQARLDARTAPAKAAGGARLQAKDMKQKAEPVSREAESGNEIAAERPLAKSANEVSSSTGAPAPAPAAPSANVAPAASAVLAAKTAPASTAQAGVMVASNMSARAEGKKKLAPPTRWMLSKQGDLLRSTDAGKNWQTVPFAGDVTFRAVAVLGPNVWVGGQGGVLYYSPDDGNQWQGLATSADGAALTEDITALTFSDTQHGTLNTASGQTWTTSDGGHSWQRQ